MGVAEGVVDLLGALAYGELSAFDRMTEDSRTAPTLAGRAALAQMAAAEIGHFTLLQNHLAAEGLTVEDAMAPFVKGFDAFHESTSPKSWLESLVKAYVGDGLAAEFYREISRHLDAGTRDLVLGVLADTGHSGFVVPRVRAAIAADARVAGRLALWGRRLVGEIMTQAQQLAGEREALTSLILGGTGPDGRDRAGIDLTEIAGMLGRITEGHGERMAALGLDA